MSFRPGNIEIFSHTMNFDFMKWRHLTIGFSAVLTVIALLIVAVKGLNYSIDFLGGVEANVSFKDPGIHREAIEAAIKDAGIGAVEMTTFGGLEAKDEGSTYVIRLQREPGTAENATSDKAEKLVAALKSKFGADKVVVGSITNISGKIGKEEEIRGYLALLLAFGGILLYIAVRFDARFSPGAVICLVHDVIIALGFMTAIGKPFSVSSIAAFLTIVGYSINDTVIVYDRIRETQILAPRLSLVEVVNRSINQTLNRTVITSATGLVALLVLSFMGGGAIEDFALTMFVGILVGTYSSIYVAAPLTLMMDGVLRKMGWKLADPLEKKKAEKDPNFVPPVVVRKKTPK